MLPLDPSPDPPTPTSTSATPRRKQVIVAELACLMCARPVGIATTDSGPPQGPVRFKPAKSATIHRLATWWRLRCPTCGGNTAATELVVRTVRLEPPTDWQADRPVVAGHRRGLQRNAGRLRQPATDAAYSSPGTRQRRHGHLSPHPLRWLRSLPQPH
jgi:hypothetical protein